MIRVKDRDPSRDAKWSLISRARHDINCLSSFVDIKLTMTAYDHKANDFIF